MTASTDLTDGQPEGIVMWRDDEASDWWVIRHEKTGVTTQGRSRLHALLMLADALAAYWDDDADLLDLAEDVFIPDEEMLALQEELAEE